jgi:hypothetical protein
MWNPDVVRVAAGGEQLQTFHKTSESLSCRQLCGCCSGHVMIRSPEWNLIDVSPAILPSLRFVPAGHGNCSESVLQIQNGLPKFRDFPGEYGGSGELVPE